MHEILRLICSPQFDMRLMQTLFYITSIVQILLLTTKYNAVYEYSKVEENRTFRLHSMVEVAAQSDYLQQRSITKRLELVRGLYHLIPSTYAPDFTANFMLRVISPQPFPILSYASTRKVLNLKN